MENLRKESLNYYLSEYLKDLKRAGVPDFPGQDVPVTAQPAARQPKPLVVPGVPAQPQQVAQPSQPTPPISQAPAQPAPRPIEIANVQTAPQAQAVDRAASLAALAAQVDRCRLCPKLSGRTHSVFGSGNPYAELCFIGEGPGAEEDLQGLPFVGRSGQLLTSMIEKGMGIPRSSVYICNIVRCRPPQNRNPEREEADACRPFLDATLDIVRPKYICCLGSVAATNLLKTDLTIGKLRGTLHEYKGAKVVCTYHPAYLLRNPASKAEAWKDLQILMREMGLPIQGK